MRYPPGTRIWAPGAPKFVPRGMVVRNYGKQPILQFKGLKGDWLGTIEKNGSIKVKFSADQIWSYEVDPRKNPMEPELFELRVSLDTLFPVKHFSAITEKRGLGPAMRETGGSIHWTPVIFKDEKEAIKYALIYRDVLTQACLKQNLVFKLDISIISSSHPLKDGPDYVWVVEQDMYGPGHGR